MHCTALWLIVKRRFCFRQSKSTSHYLASIIFCRENPTPYPAEKRQFLASICTHAPPVESTSEFRSVKSESLSAKSRQEYNESKSKSIFLNPQVVETTLLKCPSDIIALSFFMWCARQPDYFHGRVAFEHLAPIVLRLIQKFGSVSGVLEELKLVGCVIKPQTLLLLMRICWYGKMYDIVLEAAEEMEYLGHRTLKTFARNIIMDVLFKTGHVNLALGCLEKSKTPNFLSFTIAVCNLCRLNDTVNIRNVLRNFFGNGYRPNHTTFMMILTCYCRLRKMDEALQLFGVMITLGIAISVHMWSVLIDGFCKSGKTDIAANLFDKMTKSVCSPDIITVTSLIKNFLEAEMLSEAYKIINIMKSKGHYPDLVLSNVLIDCLSKVRRYEDALIVFYDLQKRKLTPDPYTFTSIMSIVCSSRLFLLLPVLINGLIIEPDLVMCNSLLSYYCKAGYPIGAVEFYDDMIDRGFTPDKYSYAGVLTGLCKSGRINEAVDVYRGIINCLDNHDTHIHTIIMDGLIKTGNFLKAIRLFRQAAAKNTPLDVVSYTVAINGLIRVGQGRDALNLFREMKDNGIAPNIKTYGLLLGEFCKHRNFDKIKEILQEMSEMGLEMDKRSFYFIKNFLCKSRTTSAFEVSVQLCDDPKLLSDDMYALLVDELDLGGVIADNGAHESNTENEKRDSESDELYDFAASVG